MDSVCSSCLLPSRFTVCVLTVCILMLKLLALQAVFSNIDLEQKIINIEVTIRIHMI